MHTQLEQLLETNTVEQYFETNSVDFSLFSCFNPDVHQACERWLYSGKIPATFQVFLACMVLCWKVGFGVFFV